MASRIAPNPLPAASLRFQVSERLPAKTSALSINPHAADKKASFPCRAAAQSDNLAEEQSASESSARSQLDLLEQLTSSAATGRGYERTGESMRPTIREQLAELTQGRDEDFTLQLGKKMKESLKKMNILTISQRRNIKRQSYLNEVARRNDAAFFATIGAFVILPPLVILAAAILTGFLSPAFEVFFPSGGYIRRQKCAPAITRPSPLSHAVQQLPACHPSLLPPPLSHSHLQSVLKPTVQQPPSS
ncbi:uncharacterized protein LOC110017878 [Phalaenopsis equestris]|uniref:uncharacterized protein LOC110017878 n=1 Tax=Phalaenopsis equestris TaxID=78828 RepID=UPI0009E50559|nr:uncharacterized protein LOC110017878 [Phalaenopsis equestris]